MSSHTAESSAGIDLIVSKTAATAAPLTGLTPADRKELQNLLEERAPRLPSHIPALDGIRGLAVLMVLFCHATGRPFGEGANEAFAGAIDRNLLSLARLSWSGVDLFFVLSGFLITGILFDAKGKNHFFRNFYGRRTVRIFPLYYACLFLFLVVGPMLPEPITRGWGTTDTYIWYPLYLSNYSQAVAEQAGHAVTHIVHVAWSLSIEEQFYLCWPLVVYFCGRKALLRICVGMFFGSMAIRIGLLMIDRHFYAMAFTPCRVDGLAVGAAIALLARGSGGLKSLVKPALWIGPASTLGLVVIIVAMSKLGFRRGVGHSPGYVACGTAMLSLMFGSLLVLAAHAVKGTWTNRLFTNRLLTVYGKYSYAVYLLHMPIIIWISNYVLHPKDLTYHGTMLPGLLLFYFITFSLSLVAGLISWHVLEKHFLKLKDYFPMEPKPADRIAATTH
jgi:peptidoglycan/LPS O-acetylase OafA/YrhL